MRLTSFSGRISRRKENRAAYKKRISNQAQTHQDDTEEGFPGPPLSVDIPPLLKAHAAAITLPTSFLFKSAFRSPNDPADTEFTDDELEKWNNLPPYTTGLEDKTHQWLSENIQNLLDALHGKSLREQHEYELKRIRRYKSMPLAEFSLEVYQDLTSYLRSWEGANDMMEQFQPGPGEKDTFRLGMQYVRWMARRTLHLWEDHQALKGGSDNILREYVERWIHVD